MLSGPRNTKERHPSARLFPMKAGAVIHAGALSAHENGLAVRGREATGLIGIGRAMESADNKDGADGDKTIAIETGCFCYSSSATDPVTRASIGKPVYIIDDETVAATSGTDARSVAGVCFDVDDSGVWVTFA